MYDASGKYIKSLCETKMSKIFSDAVLECKKYGMYLFAMTTKEEYLHALNYMNKTYGTKAEVSNIVNGALESGS